MMEERLNLNDISIRTELQAGDIGYVTYLHGKLYKEEYDFGIAFEAYVAAGLHEFWKNYDPEMDRIWVCEHKERIIGFILLMHRGQAAQLRYFIIVPGYRGIGLGKKLMTLYMEFLKEKNYKTSYLWTTSGLPASAYLYKSFGFILTEEKDSTAFGKALVEQRYDLKV